MFISGPNTSLATESIGGGYSLAAPTVATAAADKYSSSIAKWESLALGAYLSVVGPLSVVANALSIYATAARWRRRNPAAAIAATTVSGSTALTPMQLLLVILNACDMSFVVATYTMAVPSFLSERWLFDDSGCAAYGFVAFFFGFLSLMTIALMAVTRCIGVCHPYVAARLVTTRSVAVTCACLTLYSGIWSSLPLWIWGSYGVEPFGLACAIEWSSQSNASFVITMFIAAICIPMSLIVLSYGAITRHVYSSTQLVTRSSNSADGGGASGGSGGVESAVHYSTVSGSGSEARHQSRHLHTTKVGALISLSFMVCWTPYGAMSFWAAFGDISGLPKVLTPIPAILSKSSALSNAMVLFLTSKYHRTFVSRLIGTWKLSPFGKNTWHH